MVLIINVGKQAVHIMGSIIIVMIASNYMYNVMY